MIPSVLIEQILILFLIIVIGYTARYYNVLKAEMAKGLTDLLLNITLPALIITSFSFRFSKTLLLNGGIVLLSSFIIHFTSYFLGKLLFSRHLLSNRKILIFTTVFSNCGFMGIPIVESLFGKLGVFYSSIYLVGFNVLVWTLGIVIFTEKLDRKTARDTLSNPGIIAVALGMIIFAFSIPIPAPVTKTLNLVGSMTTPLSMIIIGAILAECQWKELFSGLLIYYGSFIRLLAVPLLTLVIMKLFRIDPTVLGVCILSVAMPAAATTAMFAEKYGGDTLLASRLVFLSTILSIFSIPAIMMLLA